ncbi:heme oxygenase-like protein [Xylaria intraflava]|nr:heme oxygenase-like protein [Xylaria intraflava]
MSSAVEDTNHSLSDSINIATQSVHANLNKLVLSRLRLAIPPVADDASQYVSGLIHIAPIYITLESLWKAILESPQPSANHGRIRPLLASLHCEGLMRSEALQNDLKCLTGWSDRTLAEQLNDASETPVLSNFLDHIQTTVEESPHVLLAYAWVLYMALFSGGRFVRASLEEICPAFWVPFSGQHPRPATLASTSSIVTQPLSFFRFDTPEDGEDLKQGFKERLVEFEDVLTGAEYDEIIREARCIFDYMIQLVDELDGICGTDMEHAEARLLSLRSRDSVVVEKERRQQFVRTLRKTISEASSGSSRGGEGRSRCRSRGRWHC